MAVLDGGVVCGGVRAMSGVVFPAEFRVRVYDERLEYKVKIVRRYLTDDPFTVLYTLLGTDRRVVIVRHGDYFMSYAGFKCRHCARFDLSTSVADIVVTFLSGEGFIVLLDDVEQLTLL